MKRFLVISVLLRLYPRAFRERYGEAMHQFHAERVRAGISALGWLRIVGDHVVSAGVAHVEVLRGRGESAAGAGFATIVQDMRYALRALRRRRAFAFVVLATIALGVGANTAIFSMVNGIMLRPLPYPDADRLVSFGHEAPTWLTSNLEYLDYKQSLRSFEALAAFTQNEGNLSSEEEPERVAQATVTTDFFAVLGVAPLLGRTFVADDDLSEVPNVAILSYRLWQRRYASDTGVIGREIILAGRPRTVIGVMPERFEYPNTRVDIWLPLPRFRIDGAEHHRANHYLFLIGRLRPGVSVEAARSEAQARARHTMREFAEAYNPAYPLTPVLQTVSENLVGSTRPYLWTLLGAVGFVLLIVCANVANLLLARGEGRRKEMAVRVALGAARGRLITQLLSESLVLALSGGALGLFLAWAGVRALLVAAPATLPRLDEITIDGAVLAFALLTALIAGLLFGLVPALRAAREAPIDSLRRGGRSEQHGSSRRVRATLVIAEVALAVITLSGAGMLLKSLVNLQRADLGFDTRSVLTMKVSPHPNYDDERTTLFYQQLLERVRALPGVTSAAAAGWLPLLGAGGLWGVLPEGQSYATIGQGPDAVPQQVTPGFFAAMGMQLKAGRDVTEQDRVDGPYVAVVSEAMAELLWPGADPLGKRFRLGAVQTYATVVGVVNDILSRGFADTPEPTMYFPLAQTRHSAYFMPRTMTLVVRTQGEPLRAEPAVRAIVRSLDATIPISSVLTLEQAAGATIASRRFSTTLLTGFAALALLLAGIGIFGVVSYGVHERTYELGVRMALGAGRANTIALVLRSSLFMAGCGITLGLLGASALARFLRSMLVDVPLVDTMTLSAVAGLLLLVVLAATILPAQRAMAVQPTSALRG